MLAYQFFPETGEYIGEYACQLDPVASRKAAQEIYLLPGDSTWEKPPEYNTETQTAIWTGNAWEIRAIPEPELPPELTPPTPTKAERFHADLDYVAAMLGVEL